MNNAKKMKEEEEEGFSAVKKLEIRTCNETVLVSYLVIFGLVPLLFLCFVFILITINQLHS